jgi:hypothetical protein
MEEKKICRACGIEKLITNYHKNPKMKSGIASRCKKCVAVGNRVKDPNTSSVKMQLRWDKMKDTTSKLTRTKPEDYRALYEFLSVIGYDVNGDVDVHQQFLDKWNANIKGRPMKYRKRNGNALNLYLPNGEKNLLCKRFKEEKNPHLNDEGE